MIRNLAGLGAVLIATAICADRGNAADLIISLNDNHTVLDRTGTQVAADPVRPDTADIIDISQFPPRIVQTFEVPGSVVGTPFAVWVAPRFQLGHCDLCE